jgi:peptidoglycan/xylan/chitin deacetylase (PgdA/CDA1 family)
MKKILIVFSVLLPIIILVSVLSLSSFAAESVKVPVIMYHSVAVNPDPNDTYQISLAEFKSEMDYINSNGYTTLTNDEYYNIITKKSPMPSKPILLTFDDATLNFYNNALPVLKQYGMKATLYVVTNWIGTSIRMTSDQLKSAVSYDKLELQNHTSTHGDLLSLSSTELTKRVNDATNALKAINGKTTQYFAYPYGNSNAAFVSVLKDLGFKVAFKAGGGMSTDTSDLYNMPRIGIFKNDNITSFIRKVTTGN